VDQTWKGDRIETLLRQVEGLLHAAREDGIRIAAPDGSPQPTADPPDANDSALLERATQILALRRRRDSAFCDAIFGEPAWDILLDLFAARLRGEPICITSACIAASVPQTTALRWVNVLCDRNYIWRQPDPKDARRSLLWLSDDCFDRLKAVLARG